MNRIIKTMCLLMAGAAISAGAINSYEGPAPLEIPYPGYFGNRITIPKDNPTTHEGVALGRMLFYETALSVNNRFSCATCHRQELAFTDGQVFSTGVDGTLQSRNTMSLANLLWTRHFFWDGRVTSLEQQAEIPLTNIHEMGQSLDSSAAKLSRKPLYGPLFHAAFGAGAITGERIVKALAQFERTLVSAGSKYDRYLQGKDSLTAAERRGMDLFYTNPSPGNKRRGAGCGHCHGGPKTYNELFHNNGLDSLPADAGRQAISGQPYDLGRFRVVTLRNIALTAPYMHDGRFKTLEEVISHYNSPVKGHYTSIVLRENSNMPGGRSLGLTPGEQADLLAFLHTLTDPVFITDKRFSNPFIP